MKHNIKLPDGTIQSLECKFGTGIKDYYGDEIFEGDHVRIAGDCGKGEEVVFGSGVFWAGRRNIAAHLYGSFAIVRDDEHERIATCELSSSQILEGCNTRRAKEKADTNGA